VNVDTGYMGEMDDVVRKARPGEKVIPATIIPAPIWDAASRYEREQAREQAIRDGDPRVGVMREHTSRPVPALYGPRKPLREVRRELQEARERTE
jgi:hypothetical protein